MVFGYDGISRFPSSVTSGTSVSDTGGRLYAFAPGRYQFPRVAPGSYRLAVVAPKPVVQLLLRGLLATLGGIVTVGIVELGALLNALNDLPGPPQWKARRRCCWVRCLLLPRAA